VHCSLLWPPPTFSGSTRVQFSDRLGEAAWTEFMLGFVFVVDDDDDVLVF